MLIYKGEAEHRQSARHLIHTLNSKLVASDKSLAQAKELAITEDGANLNTLNRAYPEGLFSGQKAALDRIDSQVDGLFQRSTSLRKCVLELQKIVTDALLSIETHVVDYQGASARVDRDIDESMMLLMGSVHNVQEFMSHSAENRIEGVQEILDSPSPSKLMSRLSVDVTQKQLAEEAARQVTDQVERAERPLTEHDIENITEQVVEDICVDVSEEATENAKMLFEANEDRAVLIGHTRDLADKLFPKVYEKTAAHVLDLAEA